jgi:gamma-glutamylcyclotransferase (GGCT)/AIG2-like uncharacterized protein YtfP
MKTNYHIPVFVYGTLRKGHGNYNNILKGNTVQEVAAEIHGFKIHSVSPYGGSFPCMVAAGENEKVQGELMYLDEFDAEETMRRLDRLEGYNESNPYSMYRREKRNVWNKMRSDYTEAWVYIWNSERLGKYIPSGCYNTHMQEFMEDRKQKGWDVI